MPKTTNTLNYFAQKIPETENKSYHGKKSEQDVTKVRWQQSTCQQRSTVINVATSMTTNTEMTATSKAMERKGTEHKATK